VNVLQEDRHPTLVASRLPTARTINEQIVNHFVLFVLYFQLVALLVSKPADGTVRVHGQDVILGRGITLQAPSQCDGYAWPSDPAHQLHFVSDGHFAVATYQKHFDERICEETFQAVSNGE